MRSLRFALFLLLTTVLLAEPVVHTHPFAEGASDGSGIASSSVCALCAVAAQQTAVARVAFGAPLVVVDRTVAFGPLRHTFELALPLASRAPPAA